jgi:serine/threonine protein kinase
MPDPAMTQLFPHPSRDELHAYSLGQLPEEKAVAIDDHISSCEPCCETIVSLSSDDTFTGQLQEARQLPVESAAEVPAPLAEHTRYDVERLIGRGGMGDVYKARHRVMERTVALKVINRGLVRKSEVVDRFHREVKAAAQLSHPNIVTAFDADQADDFHFMVMEYVDGVDLSQTVKDRGALPVAEACNYIRQAAIGLQHAHEQGMVHRDIKPHNLMVTDDGTVKVLDFGLASLAPVALSDTETVEGRGNLTAVGSIMGTPDFISPEQAEDARQADIRSDIYSLGATFYFLLSAQPPFDDGSVTAKLKSHALVEPEPLSSLRDDVPDELVAIVSRMMAKDPNERYLTPSQVAGALESFLRTWCPDEADSQGQDPSSGGNRSGSGGQTSNASDMSPDWIPVLGKWLFYISLIPIVLLVLDAFVLSDEAGAATDRFLYYVLTSVCLSTIGAILSGVHQFNTSNRDDHRVYRLTADQTLLMVVIFLGAGAYYFFETDYGVARIEVNDPSLQVSIQGQTITMKEGVEKPLTITPGKQMLLISKEDAHFRFHTDSFEIRRGDEITFKVEVLNDEIVVSKDGEPFDRSRIIDVVRELQDADESEGTADDPPVTASTSTSKPELKITGKTVNVGRAGLPSVYDWNFKGRDVGELKVQLLLAQNGKANVVQEFDFEELPAEFTSKVRLEVRDAVGVDYKRTVNAVLHVESPVNSRCRTLNEDNGLSVTVEAPFSNSFEKAELKPIDAEQTELILAWSYWKGDMTQGTSMESMTEATTDGKATFLFVTLDWKPVEQTATPGQDRAGQSEADFKTKLHTAISLAAGIPNAQWEKLAMSQTAINSTEVLQGEPLSSVLLTRSSQRKR